LIDVHRTVGADAVGVSISRFVGLHARGEPGRPTVPKAPTIIKSSLMSTLVPYPRGLPSNGASLAMNLPLDV
jgi:hypothetical protein